MPLTAPRLHPKHSLSLPPCSSSSSSSASSLTPAFTTGLAGSLFPTRQLTPRRSRALLAGVGLTDVEADPAEEAPDPAELPAHAAGSVAASRASRASIAHWEASLCFLSQCDPPTNKPRNTHCEPDLLQDSLCKRLKSFKPASGCREWVGPRANIKQSDHLGSRILSLGAWGRETEGKL